MGRRRWPGFEISFHSGVAAMPTTIEFLPARYRYRQRARRETARRLGGALLIVLAIVAASAWQHAQMRSVRRALARVEADYAAAELNHSRLNALRGELKKTRAAAELCVFLQLPMSHAQVLAEIANALPPEVELTELRVTLEQSAKSPVRRLGHAGNDQAATSKAVLVPGPLQDLRRLREETDGAHQLVRVSGVAFDSAAPHLFVASLNANALLLRAELTSLETTDLEERGPVTHFSVSAMVRPVTSASSPPIPLAVHVPSRSNVP